MKLLLGPLLAVLLFLTTYSLAYPHGGGLDSYGCHHNRKQGGYHCHRGKFAGQSFKSKDEMLEQLRKDKPKDSGESKEPATKQ